MPASHCSGCTVEPTAPGAPDAGPAGPAFVNAAAEHQDLARLRAATAGFHRFEVAKAAGQYDRQFPAGCFEDPAGAMGIHYIKDENVGTLDPTRPQLLMFEPQQNGRLRLVGVEFIHPGADAGALSADLEAISQRSCSVLRQMGTEIQCMHSYVTEDKITCVYIAANATLIRDHARLGGFPADRVLEVVTTIDPTTAESH